MTRKNEIISYLKSVYLLDDEKVLDVSYGEEYDIIDVLFKTKVGLYGMYMIHNYNDEWVPTRVYKSYILGSQLEKYLAYEEKKENE